MVLADSFCFSLFKESSEYPSVRLEGADDMKVLPVSLAMIRPSVSFFTAEFSFSTNTNL